MRDAWRLWTRDDGDVSYELADLQAAFMASPPHRAHVLSPRYRYCGVGIATSSDGRQRMAVDFGIGF